MRRQMVKAAGVIDQVVPAGRQFRGEDIAAVEADIDARLAGPLLAPGHGGRGKIDGVHRSASGVKSRSSMRRTSSTVRISRFTPQPPQTAAAYAAAASDFSPSYDTSTLVREHLSGSRREQRGNPRAQLLAGL